MQNGRKLHLLMLKGLKQVNVYATLECTHSCHMHPRSKYMSRKCCTHLNKLYHILNLYAKEPRE